MGIINLKNKACKGNEKFKPLVFFLIFAYNKSMQIKRTGYFMEIIIFLALILLLIIAVVAVVAATTAGAASVIVEEDDEED